MTKIKTIDEYPLPFDRDEIVAMQEESLEGNYGLRDEDDIIESVDAFHEKYIDEMIRTDEWTVFQNHWENLSGYIFFWNHQLGYGFKIDGDWEVMCAFVEMMDQFTDEYSSEDFEPNMYSWQLP